MNPQNRSEFQTYILESLGAPLVDVNITQNQIDNMIDDSILFFREYYWDGVKRAYYRHQITAQDIATGAIAIPDYIYAVSHITPITVLNVGTLTNTAQPLTLGYQILYDTFGPNRFGGNNLVFFEQVSQHISLIQNMLIAETRFSFNRLDGNLIIHDVSKMKEGQFILMDVYASLDLNQPSRLWSERLFKQYATAKCKYQWAVNLSKYQGVQLPGGVTVDSATMKADAKEEIEKIEQWILNSMNPSEIYVG